MASNTSYSSPKIEMRDSPISGCGLFAKEAILKGELILSFKNGKGKFINSSDADKLYKSGNDLFLQIGDHLFYVATNPDEYKNEHHLNHSCDPNLGIKDSLEFVAMRDINGGEELTFDYAMSESSNYKMQCSCGSKNCRRIVTGKDWKISKLQKKYNGYLSNYLRQKINI